jgi:hypothetical protein
MIQVGVQPLTSLTYLLELQRDWDRAATYELTTASLVFTAVATGGVSLYARTMSGGSERHQ